MNKQTEQFLVEHWSRQLMEQSKPSKFAQMFPQKPLTRMQKIRRRLSCYGDRVRNAWDALRGIDRD